MRLKMEIELKNYKVPQYMNQLIDSLNNPDLRVDARYVFHRASVPPLGTLVQIFFIPFDLCHELHIVCSSMKEHRSSKWERLMFSLVLHFSRSVQNRSANKQQ